MGLDLAEVLLAVEDKFKIDIWDDGLQIDTIEDFIDTIERQTALAPHSKEESDRKTQENFDKVKHFFAQELGLPPAQLTPETKTASLFKTYRHRIRVWKKMNKDFSHRFPALEGDFLNLCYTGCCVYFGFFFGFLALVIATDRVNLANMSTFGYLGLGLGACGIFVLYYLGTMLCAPIFFRIPNECKTLGGLAKSAFRSDISLDGEGKIWSLQEITEFVLQKVSDQSGVPVEKLSLSQSLVKLLN